MIEVGAARPLRIFLSAGEASGDALGARLIAAIRRQVGPDRPVIFQGIGGPEMAAMGMESLFPISDLAVMGLVEVIPHIPRLKRRIAQAAGAVRDFNPDVLVTIDAPGFNKRLVDALGKTGFPKVHYVAPTVWAWRPKRVYGFKQRFDRLLCLLPFEPPYFEKVGLSAPFVGHSVLESGADKGNGPAFRRDRGIEDADRVLCVLPGSRRNEIKHLLPIYRQTVEDLVERGKVDVIVVPVVPHLHATIEAETRSWPVRVELVTGTEQKFDAMAASNAALATSGTVSLELAMAKLPMVIGYKIGALTYQIVVRMVMVTYGTLINHLADQEVIPEFVQDRCRADLLVPAVEAALDPTQGQEQVERYAPYLKAFSPEGETPPSDVAAKAVLEPLTR